MTVTYINDQPIASSFFNEGRWLTDFVTPDALEVQELYDELTEGLATIQEKMEALRYWVASEIKYTHYVWGKIQIGNKISVQRDLWQTPSMAIQTRIGNCANKAFLLASLLRNAMPADDVKVVFGNLHQPGEGGHAWVEVNLNGTAYILETTREDMAPSVATSKADIYEPVIHFNDKTVSVIPDRTLLQPFCRVYTDWLKKYLDWSYIEG